MQKGDNQIAPQRQKKIKTTGFAQYSFVYELFKAIMVNGLKMPTPVQRKTIPVVMSGKDAIVCYKTGSGKTLSYLLPMINKLKCHSTIVGARGLVIVPTKDLAEQISKVLFAYKKYTDLEYVLLLGGHTYDGQFDRLASNPDIIIATPGRLMQLVVDTDLRLGRIEMIVFDEADQLFENGKFTMQLKEILQKCPISQRLMFSATINENLNDFAKTCLRQYSYVHQEVALPQNMKLDAYILRPGQKIAALLYLIQQIIKQQKVIIFASTRFHVDYLVSLIGSVRECYGIYGKMDVQQRSYSLDNFRKKKKSVILIVTDVAARGLDIPAVNYVIHFDYPTNHKTFIHRSGRTARKNESGNTIALISNNQIPYLVELAQYVGRKLTLDSSTKETINYGTFPIDITDSYVTIVKKLKEKNDEIEKNETLSNRAFEKFKKCRTQASQAGMKKAKVLEIQTHFKFRNGIEEEQKSFLNRIKNYAPKQSFLQLQKSQIMKQNENDPFLSAVEKIKTEQQQKKFEEIKKQKLRKSNSQKWKNILSKEQTQILQNYKDQRDKERIPIKEIEGVQIQMVNKKEKKSLQKDFRNLSQYIGSTKNPNIKTEFDELPKIKNNELDQVVGDENPVKKKKERKWDKVKKNFVWSKDKDDKISKDAKGKVAYSKWKKKNRLSLPKLGQNQDTDNTRMAKQKWQQTRRFRHGWKENKEKGQSLKNNKTKAIQKKYKKRLISKSMKSKAKRNKR